MRVKINGEIENMSYGAICSKLGFVPEVHFVEVYNSGRIGFTCGKEHEISALRSACDREGFEWKTPHDKKTQEDYD